MNKNEQKVKFAEYKDNKVSFLQNKEEIVKRKIKSIKEIGNWGRTDYFICLEDRENADRKY